MNGRSPFRVVVLNASDTPLGEITTAINLNTNERLDSITELTFSAPAGDPAVAAIAAGVLFDVYDEQDGFLGRFSYKSSTLNDNDGVATRNVSALSAAVELSRDTVGFKRQYAYHPVDQVVTELAALAGWTTECEANIGHTTVSYEGEPPLRGIDELADRWGRHWRVKQGLTRVLEFGVLGASSGVYLRGLSANLPPLMTLNTSTAIVDSITQTEDVEGIVNRVIAVGGGQGEAQLTMEGATAGDYDLRTGINQNGSLYHYVQDDDSVDMLGGEPRGVRTKVLSMTTVRQANNSLTDQVNTANTLKLAAESYLRQHKDPTVQYAITTRHLPAKVQPGDTVHLIYRGVRDRVVYLDVDDTLYVLEIQRSRSVSGDRTARLVVSTVDKHRHTDQDTLVEMVSDVRSLQLHVQAYPFWSENTYYDYTQYATKTAVFKFEIDNSVQKVSRIRIRFRTFPLIAMVAWDVTGSLLVHRVETTYLQALDDLGIFVDGVEMTTDFGGPWKTPLPQAGGQIDVTLDITDAILNSSFPLYGDHAINIYPRSNRFGHTEVPVTGASFVGESNHGWVECNIRVLGIAQAVVSE